MNNNSIKTAIDAIKGHLCGIGHNILKSLTTRPRVAQVHVIARCLLLLSAFSMIQLSPIAFNAAPVAADNLTLPTITIMPNEGIVGTAVYVKIMNYQPNKQIIVTFGTGTTIGMGTSVGTKTYVATKTTTDDSGYAVADFDIDIFPAGRYIIMADDGTNKVTGGFKLIPSIRLNDAVSGYVGDVVAVNGNGFAAKKLVYLGIDDQKLVTGETDEKGQVSNLRMAVPPCERGNHNIKVQDSDNNVATVVYNVRQQMSIMPSSAAVGDNVTVIGTGFQAVTDVLVFFDDIDAGIVQTAPDGSFTTAIKVPPCGDGVHRVKADDRTNKAYKDVSISSSLTIRPDIGSVGMPVGLQGWGFRPGFPVNLTYDNTKMEGTTVGADGGFTYNFRIPVSKFGAHVVTASDGINNRKITFTVESTPPLAPATVLPGDGERMTKDIHFEWTTVADPSGVNYTFEVADDSKFANIIMSQPNVVTNYIDITEDSKMLPGKEKPYYWRVRAVDRASNESQWSLVSSFYKGHTFFTVISNMPEWVKWVLAVLGLMLFGFMFFWIGHTIKKLRSLDDETVDDDENYVTDDYGYSAGTGDWTRQ